MSKGISIVSENQIVDYIHCPTKFQCIYERKLIGREEVTMPYLLQKTAMAFFTSLMNGRVMRTSELKKKWDRCCIEHSDYITEQRCLDGMGKLMQMYRWAEKERLMIADVRVPYCILHKRGKHAPVEIHGEIPVIAMNSNKQFEILFMDFGNRLPDQSILDMNLRYTMQSYAFYKERGSSVGVHVHNVKNDKDFFTYRISDDFRRLETTLTSVTIGIEEHLFYPRENVFCNLCSMKDLCRAWY